MPVLCFTIRVDKRFTNNTALIRLWYRWKPGGGIAITYFIWNLSDRSCMVQPDPLVCYKQTNLLHSKSDLSYIHAAVKAMWAITRLYSCKKTGNSDVLVSQISNNVQPFELYWENNGEVREFLHHNRQDFFCRCFDASMCSFLSYTLKCECSPGQVFTQRFELAVLLP